MVNDRSGKNALIEGITHTRGSFVNGNANPGNKPTLHPKTESNFP